MKLSEREKEAAKRAAQRIVDKLSAMHHVSHENQRLHFQQMIEEELAR